MMLSNIIVNKIHIPLIIILSIAIKFNGFCLCYESENDSISYNFDDYQLDSIFYRNKRGQLLEKYKNQIANGFFWKRIYSITKRKHIENVGVETGDYTNGYINGQCRTFNYIYRNEIFKIAHYKESQLNGDYYIFNLDGSLKYHTKFVRGSGFYKDYYIENVSLKEIGELENGKKNGIWNYYDNDENLIRTEKYLSGDIIESKSFNQKNNILKTVQAPLRNHLIRFKSIPEYQYNISNTRLKKEINISDSGIFIYKKSNLPLTTNLNYKIFNDQLLKGLIIGTLVDGYKYGEWIYYHKSYYENIVKIEHYDSGVLNGHYYVLDTSGTLLYQTEFKNGTGEYKDFYPESGQLMVTGKYENGNRNGDWTFYLESGEVCQIQTFENNKLIKKTMGSCPQYIMDPFLYHTKKGNNITDISLPPPPPQQEIKEVEPFYPDSWTP